MEGISLTLQLFSYVYTIFTTYSSLNFVTFVNFFSLSSSLLLRSYSSLMIFICLRNCSSYRDYYQTMYNYTYILGALMQRMCSIEVLHNLLVSDQVFLHKYMIQGTSR